MIDDTTPGFRGYLDPLELVDRTDLPYEERLTILQAWLAELARQDAPEIQRQAVLGAVQALEIGSDVQGDAPAQAPDASGYGIQSDKT